jgi:drug/metabolite transporter (DMT)-like permease
LPTLVTEVAAKPPRYSRAAELALVAIAAVWGLTFVMVQDAIEELPPMAFLAYRFVPAGLLVAIFARRALRSLGPDGWWAGIVMGVFLTAGYVFQTLGLEHTSASNAGFITGLFVVLTPLFGLVIFRIPVGHVAWAAAGLSAFGLFLLSGAGGDASLRGDGLVFGCACAFAVHILVTERAVRRYDVAALVAVQLTFCGLVCLVVAGLLGDLEAPRGATVWSALLVTSLVASALGFIVQSYAQRTISSARTALILAAEPAFAGLFGYLLQNDRLSAVGWTGAALILVAIVAVDAVPRLRPPRPLPEG